MPKQKELTMTKETQIRLMIQQEIKTCFDEITSNQEVIANNQKTQADTLARIEGALLGDKYNPSSLMKKVEEHEQYIRYSKDNNIIKDGEEAIAWYKGLTTPKGGDKRSELEILQDGIKAIASLNQLKGWFAFFGVTNVGTWIFLALEKLIK